MENQLIPLINTILKSSEFINTLQTFAARKMKSRLFSNNVRALTAAEIKKLKTRGNDAEDWKKILVQKKFKPDHIVANRFRGRCVLGFYTGKELKTASAVELPSGIYNSTIINSEIGDNCCIWNAGCISNYIINAQSVVHNVSSLECSADTTFGNGREISVGIETGAVMSSRLPKLPSHRAPGQYQPE